MKKNLLLLLIVLACIFISSCGPFEDIHYCPYCKSPNISETDVEGIYKCNNSSCGKTFGARKVPEENWF